VLKSKEHWCDRLESAALNQRLEEPAEDPAVFRRGSFKPDDPAHGMHLLHPNEPCTPPAPPTALP
jgi:hypothetical protein